MSMKNEKTEKLTRKKYKHDLLNGFQSDKRPNAIGLRVFCQKLLLDELQRLHRIFNRFAASNRATHENDRLRPTLGGKNGMLGGTNIFKIPVSSTGYPDSPDAISPETLQGLYDSEAIWPSWEGKVFNQNKAILEQYVQVNEAQVEAVLEEVAETLQQRTPRQLAFIPLTDKPYYQLKHRETGVVRNFHHKSLQSEVLRIAHEGHSVGDKIHVDELRDELGKEWLRTYGEKFAAMPGAKQREKIRKAVWGLAKVIENTFNIIGYLEYEDGYIWRKG